MKHMKFVLMLAITLLSLPTFAQYYGEDEGGLDYDALVRKLSKPEVEYSGRDPFDDVKIHAGVGMANSVFTVYHPNGDRTFAAQRGVQVAMGIDLFSRNWLAEGTFRNFGESQYENARVALKEFDLKLVYQGSLAPLWAFRMGGGIAARYLDVSYNGRGSKYTEEFETPDSVLQAGLFSYLTSKWSLGADVSVRNALIEDTPDKTAYDLTLRIDGHF